MNRSSEPGCLSTLILFIIGILSILWFNSCTDETWNDGICPECNIEYKLRGSRNNLNYYICPQCDQKVTRVFTWWVD